MITRASTMKNMKNMKVRQVGPDSVTFKKCFFMFLMFFMVIAPVDSFLGNAIEVFVPAQIQLAVDQRR